MYLSNLPKLEGKHRKAKRIGRGVGSGKGSHTSSKGQKGQKARSGFNLPTGFEGGQSALYKKMPKKHGFVNSRRREKIAINVSMLNVFNDGDKVTINELAKMRIVGGIDKPVKILGNGDLKKKLTLEGFAYSKSAEKKVADLGGKIS